MVRVAPEDGRTGDVWRIEGPNQPMVVRRVSRRKIVIDSIEQPTEFGWAFGLDEWDDILYRLRENIAEVQVGDTVNLYIPETDVYLLEVNLDNQRPVLSRWFGWRAGEWPTPEVEDSGLNFHPSEGELTRLCRPYEVLDAGTKLVDARGTRRTFQPPFHFHGEEGERGVPVWPLTVPDSSNATTWLNDTSHDEQISIWQQHARVEPTVFDLTWPEFD